MARAPVTTKVALGRCSGGQGRAFRLQALDPPGETQSWVPEPFTAGKESENCRAPVQFHPIPHLSDEETEAQGGNENWPRQHREFFPASSTEPLLELVGVNCQVVNLKLGHGTWWNMEQ